MYVVGLTGGIGCGKTTVSNFFEALDIEIIDTDLIARQVVEPGSYCLNLIDQRYDDILVENGALNRRKLRQIIFSNKAEKAWLENLTHPVIVKEALNRLGEAQSAYSILSSPLLLETETVKLTNRVLIVSVPPETQISRAITRDNTTREDIEKIISTQIDHNKRLALADDVIDNSGTKEETQKQVKSLHQKYLQLAEEDNDQYKDTRS